MLSERLTVLCDRKFRDQVNQLAEKLQISVSSLLKFSFQNFRAEMLEKGLIKDHE